MEPDKTFHSVALEDLLPLAHPVVADQQDQGVLSIRHAAIQQNQRIRPTRQAMLCQTVPRQVSPRRSALGRENAPLAYAETGIHRTEPAQV
jgi:hypothetical protein